MRMEPRYLSLKDSYKFLSRQPKRFKRGSFERLRPISIQKLFMNSSMFKLMITHKSWSSTSMRHSKSLHRIIDVTLANKFNNIFFCVYKLIKITKENSFLTIKNITDWQQMITEKSHFTSVNHSKRLTKS